MKFLELPCVVLVVSCAVLNAPARAAETNSAPAVNFVTRPESSYPRLVLEDARLVLTAPVRWDVRDWLWFSADALVVAGVALAADPGVEGYVEEHNSESISRALKWVEPFGAEYAIGLIGAFYAGGLITGDSTARHVGEDGIVASILAGGIITPALKLATGRTRPRADGEDYDFHPFSGNASFPSGHATEAFAVASVVTEYYDGTWVEVLSYGVASLVAAARVDHTAHYVSDVVAGALIGSSVGKVVVRTNARERSGLTLQPVIGDDFVGLAACTTF